RRRPRPAAAPPPRPEVAPPAAATLAARAYYARVQANYLSQGLLRTDGGGGDAPFTRRDLVENFLRIAFYEEFTETDGRLVADAREARLRRWTDPVRLSVVFGRSVPLDERADALAVIGAYADRLSALTRHSVRLSAWRPNHTVLILNADEREDAGPRLAALAPGISAAAIRSVTAMRPDIYCTVFTFWRGAEAPYFQAVTVIRGELPKRMRDACIHEELAQSLGLVNDSPRARPSIFNDNEEFALLTVQDELMLRMLYDPRLTVGMSLAEARPIVEQIAAELMAGDG
ncbi:DUF2927 domain-containing protein, partial [Albidovulum sp.]